MLLKFTGQYTNGRTTITYGGVTFEGYEPAEVEDAALARRLLGSEFELAEPLDHDGDGKKGGSKAPEGDLTALRAEYKARFGKKAFPGWDEATLRTKMEA